MTSSFRYRISTFTFLFVAIHTLIAQDVTTRAGKDYALFFAVQNYDSWNDLRNPIRDAEAIAEELKERYGFRTEIVREPSRKKIYSKLREYHQKSYAEDAQLFIFFAG